VLGLRALARGRTTVVGIVAAANVPFLAFVLCLGVVVAGVMQHGLGDAMRHLLPIGTTLPALLGVADLAETARTAGAKVELSVRAGDLPPAVGAAAYRIVQEALTNAVRHAGPEPSVGVDLHTEDGALRLSVTDDGAGTAPGTGAGFGLVGMRERARSVGGTLDAGPRSGGGFEVTAVLPLEGSR
jgi:signal transduction histidine kinase